MKRAALVFTIALVFACKRDSIDRCAHCGMKLTANSPWSAEIDDGPNVRHFDTPRCALTTWIDEGKKGTVRVEDYYDRALRPASELSFVIGSDVVGPMGSELVPVDAARVAKFEKDHGGTRALTLAEIDAPALRP